MADRTNERHDAFPWAQLAEFFLILSALLTAIVSLYFSVTAALHAVDIGECLKRTCTSAEASYSFGSIIVNAVYAALTMGAAKGCVYLSELITGKNSRDD